MTKVTSPCIRNCCLDDQDICLGCARSLEEITLWHQASEEQRRQILDRARQRQQARTKDLPGAD
ncbi:DUF1289 domain-containing protein [Aestuariirhabdus litorea]|uniref:DUF1289 domain-containing protein n=1 Tax=Aestuariirhabdus litorea TaxID=2528527 RepID=A0A3P3VPG7_9GAMM|nr:DUF1289 domain-containing protein [Aestuariirhabdus litorea]RRJ84257.1 DUF1289 domain-containing protein [Aestuariirhabdus litorea]RWW97479.1 DUF1289 domain-containing protein [Endozoicomonadaceae bacterium GTF-13]